MCAVRSSSGYMKTRLIGPASRVVVKARRGPGGAVSCRPGIRPYQREVHGNKAREKKKFPERREAEGAIRANREADRKTLQLVLSTIKGPYSVLHTRTHLIDE